MVFIKTELKTKDGLAIYDFADTVKYSTMYSLLAGPELLINEIEIKTDKLPEGFRWVSSEEIERLLSL